ncbi:MAG: NAD(P)/FAD-dependent oxidoreductase [Polyangiaceae bacterium]
MLHFDVVIVGGGLSGIGAADQLKRKLPHKTFVVLEGRDALGGTWDLFRYPGIRSDSDMFTLGYAAHPWREEKAVADGPSILEYVRRTAREGGIEPHIRYRRKVVGAHWSSRDARWTLEVENLATSEVETYTCGFLYSCTGYYDYEKGHTPEFPGRERFLGTIVHPQHWPADLDYAGKRIVVIGSGATAVTLVPALAKRAAHVVMLQRSPTYIFSMPAVDARANWLREHLPEQAAYHLSRWKNVAFQLVMYNLARKRPEFVASRILAAIRRELPNVDVDKHFHPAYKPWDQRLCLVPDGDLFIALREGRASMATDTIETFTERGLRLGSGQELEADVVVTATGLDLLFMGGMSVTVDGAPLEVSALMNYKGSMFSDVPNLALAFGYTNASWTLKADLTAEYVCRVLAHMDKVGARVCVPRRRDPSVTEQPFVDFTPNYILRAAAYLPKQGSKRPWRLYQNYLLDILMMRYGAVDDGVLEFSAG